MSVVIVGMGTAKDVDLEDFRAKPEFRKATLNMILAAASQDEALRAFAEKCSKETLASAMMILGSSYGELGVTISFLDYFSKTGVARPLLFQNSLHNSTLGFLALRLNIQGPAFTVSNSTQTGENTIDLATVWLSDASIPFCIVTCVDSVVTQLQLEDQRPIGSLGEGAGTLILTRQSTAEKYGWTILGQLDARTLKHENVNPGYHSDAVEKLIERVRAS